MVRLTVRLTRVVAVLVLAAGAGRTAAAQSPLADAVNGNRAPSVNTSWAVTSAGWFYTPAASYTLAGIFTRFAAGGSSRALTVELLTAPRATGGVLLRSAAFTAPASPPGSAASTAGGSFLPITLVGGTTYFVGFRNLAAGFFDAVGINVTADADAARLVYRSDNDGSGSYADALTSFDPIEARPILLFAGAPAAVVPEPAPALLVGVGALVVGGVARRRARRGADAPEPPGPQRIS